MSRGQKGGDTERGEEEADAGCARDENRGAGFQVENEMELNDS